MRTKGSTLAGYRHTRHAMFLAAGAVAAGSLAAVWMQRPDWFLKRLAVPYPFQVFLENYNRLLIDFPLVLWVTGAALAALALVVWRTAGRTVENDSSRLRISVPVEFLIYAALLVAAGYLSLRHWEYWGRPKWDNYWLFARVLHDFWTHPGAETWFTLQKWVAEFPHSPSPLTPVVISVLMVVYDDPLRWLQMLSFGATIGSLALVRSLGRRLAPDVPTWLLGALFLTHAATMRNSLFIQLDAISSFFVLAFYWLWFRWRDEPTQNRLTALVVFLIAAVMQKTTLFPLLAIPFLAAVYDDWRAGRRRWLEWLRIGLATAALPAALFGGYLLLLGVGRNFGTQVELMGSGWNELDFSLTRFAFATGFLVCPYLPLVFGEQRWDANRVALAAYPVLFLLSVTAVRGPYWSRYYSHLLGPLLLLAAPHLARLSRQQRGAWLAPTYVAGVAAVQYTMIAAHIF
ncbi:MAG: hypothetical protein P9L99_20710 [Candidatus Lernaella stagnicola]|nr:hypothetical protein [Candidatus Lernaella stagnicola]